HARLHPLRAQGPAQRTRGRGGRVETIRGRRRRSPSGRRRRGGRSRARRCRLEGPGAATRAGRDVGMSGPDVDAVAEAVTGDTGPEIRRNIVQLDMVDDISIDGGSVTVTVLLTIAGCPLKDTITRDTKAAVARAEGVTEVSVVLGTMTPEQRKAMKEKLQGSGTRDIPFNRPDSLTKVYAVASGKGGVGKSSVTANLAVSLAAKGLRVGLVDADIYGFSIPGMLGLSGKPTRVDDMILPQIAHEVKVMSIGMFVPPSQAVVWRGPMLHRALQQFLTDVFWGDLDVLLLD